MRPKTLNWGTGIAATYVLFAAGTLAFVAFAVSQPVELVATDYYSRSLRHDQKLEAQRRGLSLAGAVSAAVAERGDAIVVALPPAHASRARGTVTLYRPSDARADRVVPLAPGADGRQRIPLAGLPRGRWLLQLEWTMEGRAFYWEQAVVTP